MTARVASGALAVAIGSVMLPGCRPSTVALAYRYRAGDTHLTSLAAEARAAWRFSDGTGGNGSYRMIAEVEEHVVSVDDRGGAVLEVEMRPEDIQETDLRSPGLEVRTFVIRVDATGRVLRVLSVDGASAVDLTPEETAFIGSFRPPLPAAPVEVGDRWQSLGSAGSSIFAQAITEATLAGLDRRDGSAHALIGVSGRGPAVWRTSLPQGDASLTGSITAEGDAVVRLETGVLSEAAMHIQGAFEVRIARSGGAEQPLAGRLDLELDIEVERR